MRSFTRSTLAQLETDTRLPQRTRDAARAVFDKKAAALSQTLRCSCAEAEASIEESFDKQVAPQLKQGADTAQGAAMQTAQAWGMPQGAGGLHWATYKATTRRDGVFRINMNEAHLRGRSL